LFALKQITLNKAHNNKCASSKRKKNIQMEFRCI